MPRTTVLLSLLSLALLAGCGESKSVQPVTGTVTYQGKPLDHGMVSFFPAGARPIGAPIGSAGTYQCELPPGQYQAIVVAPPKLPEGFKEGDRLPPPDPNALPAKFGRQQSSGLSATITLQSEPQVVDFSLK